MYGVGLVDIAAIMEKNPIGSEGSLAEEIETKNTFAKAYMDYLLGRVMKCDRVEQLRIIRFPLRVKVCYIKDMWSTGLIHSMGKACDRK